MTVRRAGAVAVAAVVTALVGACGASGDDGVAGAGEDDVTTTTSAGGSSADFGSLTEVCGPGGYSVDPDQQGLDNGMLNIGVGTDRASDVRPGLNQEMWDASVAFSRWCNERGGIGGLEINVVELSAALFEVESAMATACTDVFAMVGGGMVQDDLQFSGKDASDFHRCGLIDIPGYAVSLEKSGSNGMVQPQPNNGWTQATTWLRDYRELYPEEAEEVALVYGDLPSLLITRDKYLAALEDLDIPLAGTFSYPVVGVTDWTPLALEVVRSGATTMLYVGEPANAANLLARLAEQGWEGVPLFETNIYDQGLLSAGAEGPDGAVIRMTVHPVEEAERWPALAQLIEVVEEHVEEPRIGPLGIQSMSAWLLFATAARSCAEANDGVLDRTCILEQAAAQDEWTGGGLHAPSDPAARDDAGTTPCGMLVVVRDGAFERLHPEIDGDEDDVAGFHCPDDGVTEIPENEDTGAVDPDRPI